MTKSDPKRLDAIEDLWTTVFGEAPAIRCDPQFLADVLIRNLPPVPPYGDPPSRRDREPLPRTRAPDIR